MDPFFASRGRSGGNPWGQHPGYVEDVYRTYGGNKVPKRDPEAFQRALEYRERERASWQAERDTMAGHLQQSGDTLMRLTDAFKNLNSKYSKLRVERDELAASGRDRSGDTGAVRLEPTDAAEPDTGAVAPSDVRGQADEHGAAGRPDGVAGQRGEHAADGGEAVGDAVSAGGA